MNVRLDFEGSVVVEVDADPENPDGFCDAVAAVWAKVPIGIAEAATLVGHRIVEPEEAGDEEAAEP